MSKQSISKQSLFQSCTHGKESAVDRGVGKIPKIQLSSHSMFQTSHAKHSISVSILVPQIVFHHIIFLQFKSVSSAIFAKVIAHIAVIVQSKHFSSSCWVGVIHRTSRATCSGYTSCGTLMVLPSLSVLVNNARPAKG